MFLTTLSISFQPLYGTNSCKQLWAWIKHKMTPSPAQRNTALANASRFVSDLTFRNFHIILPGSLASYLSLDQLQNLHQKNLLTYGIITWIAGTFGQMAILRHLEQSSHATTLSERSIACFVSGIMAAVLFRVATDYILLLAPTEGLVSSTFLIISLGLGPIVTIKTSYLVGNAAQKLLRIGKGMLRKMFRRNTAIRYDDDFEIVVEERNHDHVVILVDNENR